MNALKRLNQALPGLLLGIVLYGILIQFIGIWFAEDKIRFSSGLWIGIACAIGMGIHIAIVIEQALRLPEGSSTKRLSVYSVLRYLVIVAVFFVMMYFRLGSLVSAFIGILGLKVSAYAQPLMHKLIFKDSEPDESAYEIQEEEVKL